MDKIKIPDVIFRDGDDISSAFAKMAQDKANQTALIFKDRRVTWLELGQRVNQVANVLIKMGVKTGDRVCILSLNCVEYVEAFFGALAAGCCAAPLPSMASTNALKLMVEDSCPKALFVSAQKLELVAPFIDSCDCFAKDGLIGFDFKDDKWQNYGQWLADSPKTKPDIIISKNDDFNIIYSSGTTGAPKGITHSHGVRKAFTDHLGLVFKLPNMVNIISTPFYSNTTMVAWLSAMRYGTASIIMEKFDEHEFLELCQAHKVSIAMLVPAQYERILKVKDFDDFDLSSMLLKMCTSAPLSADMKRKILDKMPGELAEVYGLTEGGVATLLLASQSRDKLSSVGQPAPGCTIKVIDENDKELPIGQTGELVGRGPIMMKGYLNQDKATSNMLWKDSEGDVFYKSGDIGRMDEDSYVYVLDRKKDVIISGGFNIYPIDIEAELLAHEAVCEAAVIGIPDKKWGETPLALVIPEKNSNTSPESICKWANARLGKAQRISRLEFVDKIPKNPIGKILKKELRRPYWKKTPDKEIT